MPIGKGLGKDLHKKDASHLHTCMQNSYKTATKTQEYYPLMHTSVHTTTPHLKSASGQIPENKSVVTVICFTCRYIADKDGNDVFVFF